MTYVCLLENISRPGRRHTGVTQNLNEQLRAPRRWRIRAHELIQAMANRCGHKVRRRSPYLASGGEK